MKESTFLKRPKLLKANQDFLTSCESKNIEVVDYAENISLKPISFIGIEKSRESEKSHLTFKAPSSDTAITKESHTIIGHEICSIIDKEFS